MDGKSTAWLYYPKTQFFEGNRHRTRSPSGRLRCVLALYFHKDQKSFLIWIQWATVKDCKKTKDFDNSNFSTTLLTLNYRTI